MKYKAGVFVNFNGSLVRRSRFTPNSCTCCIRTWREIGKIPPCWSIDMLDIRSCNETIGRMYFPIPLKDKVYNNILDRYENGKKKKA